MSAEAPDYILKASPKGELVSYWIAEIKESLYAKNTNSAFIEDIDRIWQAFGRLTIKQFNALQNWYERLY